MFFIASSLELRLRPRIGWRYEPTKALSNSFIWSHARELAKAARRDRQGFDCAPFLNMAKTIPRQEFKREVDCYLTGKQGDQPNATNIQRGACGVSKCRLAGGL
jgi:hypothetical protein